MTEAALQDRTTAANCGSSEMAQQAVIVKGCPRDKWDEVQAIQHRPFIYIHYSGSGFAGAEPAAISELLDVLASHALSLSVTQITPNPREGIPGEKRGEWIDGDRMYECDGVTRFSGNFDKWSHGFCIDTNDPETIAALTSAISGNSAFAQ